MISEKETREAFDAFFDTFPKKRRGTREKTYIAYKRALIRGTPKEIMDGCIAYTKSEPGIYAKGCEAWLNGDRWTWDYSPEPKPMSEAVYREIKRRIRDGGVFITDEERRYCRDYESRFINK